MRRIILAVFIIVMTTTAFGQTTQGFNYQTVVRDANGVPLSNKTVAFHISLKSGDGTITYYSENHEKTTSSLGVASLAVGEGTVESGSFETIPWSTVSIQMSVEIKPQGNTTFTDMGSVILRPVPFAMYALNGQPGPQGIPGEMGPQGPIGLTGPQGPEGKEGLQGVQGPQGLQGAAGTGLTNKGGWTNGASYISGDYVFATASIGTDNSMWVCNSAILFVSTIQPKDDPSNWVEFQAPAGPQGLQGIQGDQGPKGDEGPIGLTGSIGLTGPQGIGITQTINNGDGTYTFMYSDNSQFTTSDLTGPQGIQGPQGSQGIQGIQGPQGIQGAAGIGLNNKGLWQQNQTYSTNDYVFSESSTNALLNTMWIVQAASSFTSTLKPKDDLTNWIEFEAPQGLQGEKGDQGLQGLKGDQGIPGASIQWLGTFSAEPPGSLNNAYYNDVLKKTYIHNGTAWVLMVQDGASGTNGINGTDGTNGTNGTDGISIDWRGIFSSHPSNPSLNWAYYNSIDKKSYIYGSSGWVIMTQDGANGANGTNGLSIIWKGTYTSDPTGPSVNWAYYNSSDKKSYIYNGSVWQVITQDGSTGATGATGSAGTNGISINWRGPSSGPPSSPQLNDAYYDLVQKKSYIYNSSNGWDILTQDGIDGINGTNGIDGTNGTNGSNGTNGISINWQGSFTSAPGSPSLNWAYYNSTDKKSYIYNGSAWVVMTQDGATGLQGPIGPQGPAGTGLINKGNWSSSSSYVSGDYVFDRSLSDPLINSMWICQLDRSATATQPYQDLTHWSEFQAPKGETGATGPQGIQGIAGSNGISLYWRGSFSSAPASPSLNHAYYNTTDKKSYVYDNTNNWQIIAQDGMPISGSTSQTLYYSGSTWTPSSVLVNNGVNIGIGSAIFAPTTKLDVNGGIRLRSMLYDNSGSLNPGSSGQILTSTGTGILWKSPTAISGVATGSGLSGQVALWTGSGGGLQGLTNLSWANSLQVKSLATAVTDDPIFEVKNKNGQVIFGVYEGGVRIYFDDSGTKGARGGFAVGGLSQTKAAPYEYFRITSDSARVYVKDIVAKGARGGFAVGGLSQTKGTITNFMNVTPKNYFIGHQSGSKNTTGLYNSFFGFQAGASNTTGNSNVFVGHNAGNTNSTSSNNVFIGFESGLQSNSTWGGNVFIGYQTGRDNTAVTAYYNSIVGYQAGMSNSGNYNSFYGYNSGKINTGNYNSFYGPFTGFTNDGTANSFYGYASGYNNQTGSYNVFMGNFTGYSSRSGKSNVFIGNEAGRSNTLGDYNVFLGYKSGYSDTSSYNTFIGYQTGYNNFSGKYNVYLGHESGYNAGYSTSLDPSYNTYIGYQTGYNIREGHHNTFIGYQSGFGTNSSLTTGSNNTALGYSAGYSLTSGNENVFLGTSSGSGNTTGYNNVYIGYSSGKMASAGYYNTFLGSNAGENTTNGDGNVFIGYTTGQANTTGGWNTFVGYRASAYKTAGENNLMMGVMAGLKNETGSFNTFLGSYTGRDFYSGDNNTFVGYHSGYGSWSTGNGNQNTVVGSYAGNALTDGDGNVFIGYQAGYSEDGSNKLYIANSNTTTPLIWGDFTAPQLRFNANVGVNTAPSSSYGIFVDNNSTAGSGYGAYGLGGNMGVRGEATVSGTGTRYGLYGIGWYGTSSNYGIYAYGYGGTTAYGIYALAGGGSSANWAGYFAGDIRCTGSYNPSDIRMKKNISSIGNALDKLAKIRGVYYEWDNVAIENLRRSSSENQSKQAESKNDNEPLDNKYIYSEGTQVGVIAQEVEEILPEAVKTDVGGVKIVDYTKLTPLLIEAIKEQQKQIQMLIEEVEKLKAK